MENRELRDYIDRLRDEGYTVRDDHGEDPDLIDINGKAVDTLSLIHISEPTRLHKVSRMPSSA